MRRALLPILLSLFSLGCASHAAYYGYAPGPGYVWTPGYYVWAGSGYNWVGGRWAVPPRPHAGWVPGHYVRRHGHAEYVSGHWR